MTTSNSRFIGLLLPVERITRTIAWRGGVRIRKATDLRSVFRGELLRFSR
jgi:hypothetical protein